MCWLTRCGILYLEQASGLAVNNVCRDNECGFCITSPARPTLHNNNCNGNRLKDVAYQ